MGDASTTKRAGDASSLERDERGTSQIPNHANHPGQASNYNFQTPYAQHHIQSLRSDLFNMNQLSGALHSYQDFGNQIYSSSPSAQNFQSQSTPKFVGSSVSPHGHNVPYGNAYTTQFPGQYLTNPVPSTQSVQAGIGGTAMYYNATGYATHPQQAPHNYYMQQPQYMPQGSMYPVMPGAQQYPTGPDYASNLQQSQRLRDQSMRPGYSQPVRSSSRASNSSSVVRGPPRKPRQSGHAIWIGNLPPQADLMSLVNHVCKETIGLESLFLISKSNCAFANFKDQAACSEAQAKVHDSRFQTVRLVSRLRRNSNSMPSSATGTPTASAELAKAVVVIEEDAPSPTSEPETIEQPLNEEIKPVVEISVNPPAKDKFFIVKSLTVEDLDLSVRNGIWATQLHNEEVLNKAYETTENVYLIFSANKSGEYFGYARMTSQINDDPAAAIEFAPKAQPVEDPSGELPKAISTAANEFTPKGRIIDDSARGTIFWEAERDETEEEEEDDTSRIEQDGTPAEKAWGKPFNIEWISTNRLPFYKTRGLRNPWNSNREVKIARDGTELETTIGRRLLGLFHRVPSPIGPVSQMPPMQIVGGYPAQGHRY